MIQKLKPPQTTDPGHLMRQVYDDLNNIIEAVNKEDQRGRPANTEGQAGDLRLVKGRHGQYYLHMRFEDGWVTSGKNIFQFARSEEDLHDIVTAGQGLTATAAPAGKPYSYEVALSEDERSLMVALAVAL